jgi:hypothetical protein
MYTEVPLKRTIGVICTQFEAAEKELQTRIRESFPCAEEEQITLVLQECLHQALGHASRTGQIARAFASDLRASRANLKYMEPERLSSGLVAEASWHKRATETKTGGDFGLVIVRPRVAFGNESLHITEGHQSGLLVQAKRKLMKGKWRRLTKSQLSVLPERFSYSALALYELLDESSRELAPVRWQLCERHTITTVRRWLREGSFPQLVSSSDIIVGLGKGSIGTNDRKIIDDFVAPAGERTLVIRIHWHGRRPPSSDVRVIQQSRQQAVLRR